jgi:8-oxo-dGTP pyrophosphatase MutT (NUDIX family)
LRLDIAQIRQALACHVELPLLGTLIDLRNAKVAAVVIPVRLEPEPAAILVMRGSQLKDHAGEVGFPGGKPEPGDVDLLGTALRELEEEIAVRPDEVEILGELRPTPVITGRYLIHPFFGALRPGAAPRVASPEIARIIELPIAPLLTGERRIAAILAELKGVPVCVPHFELDGCTLFGASACIFYEVLTRLAKSLGRALPSVEIVDEPPWGDQYPR